MHPAITTSTNVESERPSVNTHYGGQSVSINATLERAGIHTLIWLKNSEKLPSWILRYVSAMPGHPKELKTKTYILAHVTAPHDL